MPLAPWASLVVTGTLALGAHLVPSAPEPHPVESVQAWRTTTAAKPAKVLVVSVDSMGSRALRKLGSEGTPTLHRLLAEGTGTLNARTVREQTLTLSNHTSMVTGRRVRADRGGHGVWWDDGRLSPRTVQEAAGHRVASLFTRVASRRRHPGLFVSKQKLSLFDRSWPRAVDRFVVRRNNGRLVRLVRKDLVEHRRALTFVHLSRPDLVGHEHGFLSPEHLAAVTRADRQIGTLMTAIEQRPKLARRMTVIVTADHGGKGESHSDPARPVDYRIPFLVWGSGVAAGTDLYDLNPDYGNPRKRRTTYRTSPPPVRDGDVANLVTDLLGLGPVKGSRFDRAQDLDVS